MQNITELFNKALETVEVSQCLVRLNLSMDSLRHVYYSLGTWCTMQLLNSIYNSIDRVTNRTRFITGVSYGQTNSDLLVIKKLLSIVGQSFSHLDAFPDYPISTAHISSQAMELINILFEYQKAEEGRLCGIVFVQRRYSAIAIAKLINSIFSETISAHPIRFIAEKMNSFLTLMTYSRRMNDIYFIYMIWYL